MTQHDTAAPRSGPVQFSTADHGSAEQAFERYRELTAELCDVTMLGHVADFRVTTTTWHLAGAILLENRSSTLRYDRTARHVALGINHFQVAMYLSGGAEFVLTDHTLAQRAGDVSIIDMSQPSQTRELPGEDGSARVLTCMLPRVLLSPSLSIPDTFAPVSVLRRDEPYGRMLGDHLLAIRRCAGDLTHAQSQAAVHALVQLVVGSAGPRSHAQAMASGRSKAALQALIKRHIEQNLGSESLDVKGLCDRFGLSRANLYRLFGATGPASYIQQRRLHRSFAMLISPAFRSWRILDIALECHFSSDVTFIRAFRKHFGLTPGEARELSSMTVQGAAQKRRAGKRPAPDAEAVQWVRQLTGAMPELVAQAP